MPSTLLILASKLGYQTRAFAEAAAELGLNVAYGTDRCHQLADPWGDHALPLQFEDPEASARQVVEFARATPLAGVVALGDRPTPTAARACAALALPFHPASAADVCRDKYSSRTVLRQAGLSVPDFARLPITAELASACATAAGQSISFPLPWVIKPLSLSASRGVIRADTRALAAAAFERVRALLRSPEVAALRDPASAFIQVEQYVPGVEVAVEALVERGQFKLLAIFDKPDPLTGPYFEETIYVTPSRLPAAVQQQIAEAVSGAVRALELRHGPLHAELRIELEPASTTARHLWIMEVGARCIGGLCARSLRFVTEPQSGTAASSAPEVKILPPSPEKGEDSTQGAVSLESLLVRLALGHRVSGYVREPQASGVMMIPVPREGIFEGVSGVDDASAVEHVEAIEITAKPGQRLAPLPEGSSYPGFIFARAPSPAQVEAALRAAHSRLRFSISPSLPVFAARSR